MSDWFYFSFVDTKRPKGDQFVGGCYVEVPTTAAHLPYKDMLWHALKRTHELGINPGGNVQALGPIPAVEIERVTVPNERHKLLTRDEIEAADRRVLIREAP